MIRVPRPRIDGNAIRGFARGLKSYVGVGGAVIAENARKFLRSTRTGLSALDEIVRVMNVRTIRRGVIEMGNSTVGEVRRLVRAADLDGLARTSGVDVTITSTERSAFRDTMRGTPEMAVHDVAQTRVNAARANADLDVTNASQLTSTARSKLTTVTKTLTKRLGQGAAVALVIGATVITADWAITATERRKGCFMMTTINGKSTSCKVAAFTCQGPKEGDLCSSQPNYYNATLVLMHVAQMSNDDPIKAKLATAVSLKPEQLKEKLAWVLDNKYTDAVDAITAMGDSRPRVTGICEITDPQIEGGVVPACRICSPSDDPSKTTFIDSNQYGDNISFYCSINPTILDTIADAAVSTGINLWDGLTGGIGGILKKVGIAAAIVVAIAVVVAIVVLIVRNIRGGSKNDAAPTAVATPLAVYSSSTPALAAV